MSFVLYKILTIDNDFQLLLNKSTIMRYNNTRLMHSTKETDMKKFTTALLLMALLITPWTYAETDEPSSWAIESIEAVSDQDILDEVFFSDYGIDITRQQFAYLGVKLYEYYTGETATEGSASFTDTQDEWALKAKNVGIVGGYPDGTFKPDQSITRQELAVLFVNTLKAAEVDYTPADGDKFADDISIADWAKTSVYIAKANGIVSGVGENQYNPTGNATKEQSLVMFRNVQVSDQIAQNAELNAEKTVLIMYGSEL